MGRVAAGLSLVLTAGTIACSSSEPTGPDPETLSTLRPSCEHPAPLLGKRDPRVPSFIVVYHADVDADRETVRLVEAYGFQPRYVWTAGRWDRPPRPGAVWVEPRWEPRGNGYVFIEGYWR